MDVDHFETKEETREDPEWVNAKDFKEIPGPSTYRMLRDQLPGGNNYDSPLWICLKCLKYIKILYLGHLYKTNLLVIEDYYRKRYGDIFRINGIMGKPDSVFTFNPADFETVYRTETVWPVRLGLESFAHYRINKRSEVFQGVDGLITS